MKQAYTSQTNPATLITLHPEFPVNLISLAGGFIPGDTDLILPGGGIIQQAPEIMDFQGPFYDRDVDLSVARTFCHVPVIRRYEGIGQGCNPGV